MPSIISLRMSLRSGVLARGLPNVTAAVSIRRVTKREPDEMVGEFSKQSRRHQLFVRQLTAALVSEPEAALDLAARYEQACLDEAARTPAAAVGEDAADAHSQFAQRLVAEANRLAMRARLEWVRYVRRELKASARENP
jgi:hypothetical protein